MKYLTKQRIPIFLLLFLFSITTTMANDNGVTNPGLSEKEATAKVAELQQKADVLLVQLKDLKVAKRSAATATEKKAIRSESKKLRGELEALNAEAKAINSKGIYIGTGTLLLVIIILLLL